jgi:hypothetical protein
MIKAFAITINAAFHRFVIPLIAFFDVDQPCLQRRPYRDSAAAMVLVKSAMVYRRQTTGLCTRTFC